MQTRYLHISVCLVFLFPLLGLFGQEQLNIRCGKIFDPGDAVISNLMDEDEKHFYFIKTNNEGYIEFNTGNNSGIVVFDRNLNRVQDLGFQIQSVEKTKRLKPVSFFKTSTGFIILCSQYSASGRSIRSFVFRVNDDGEVMGELLNPGQMEDVSLSQAKFDFFALHEFATDSMQQYVFTFTTPSSLNIPERINFIIYDENLAIKGSRILSFPDDFIDYNIAESISFGSGLFFIRVEIINPYAPDETIHQLVVYNIVLDSYETWELKFENGEVRKLAMYKTEGGFVGMSGFFVKDSDSEIPLGIFYYLFDGQTGALLKQKIHAFAGNELALLNPKNRAANSPYKYFEPQAIHITTHNQILLLFEYYWKSILLIRDQEGMLYDEPYYYANEIFVFRFDVHNNFAGVGMIPKQQALGHHRSILGFQSFLSQNSLNLLYNDHPKNRLVKDESKLKTMKGKYEMMWAEYNYQDGLYTKSIVGSKKQPIKFYPGKVLRSDKNSLLFFDEGDELRLVEFILE